jgi:mitochondrial fission protein ELM1
MDLRNVCWVLTTGEAGMRSQAIGLAAAVGLPIEEKRIGLRRAWTWLPGGLLPVPLLALAPSSDPLAPPWPRLIVGCGRRSIGIALTLRRLSGNRTFAVYVQNPELGRHSFDMVVALPHDGVTGDNVVTVETAMHPVTEAGLAEARAVWAPRLAPDAAPLVGVLLGGDNGSYRLTPGIVEQLIRIIRGAHAARGMRVAVTPSRRTGAEAKQALHAALAAEPWAYLWDERGDNPYFGILAAADRLIVTGESISMISEALATGRPVHVLPLAGRGRRHDAFLRRMIDAGFVSAIDGTDLDWGFAGRGALNATPHAAAAIRARLAARGDLPI